TSYRYATIIRLYREGARLADLALQFNISHDRVRQIIEQAKRSLRPAGRNLSENTDRTQKSLRLLTRRRSMCCDFTAAAFKAEPRGLSMLSTRKGSSRFVRSATCVEPPMLSC